MLILNQAYALAIYSLKFIEVKEISFLSTLIGIHFSTFGVHLWHVKKVLLLQTTIICLLQWKKFENNDKNLINDYIEVISKYCLYE